MATILIVSALPSHEIKTNPASSVPAMAPIAPAANMAPSARPDLSAPLTAICAKTGAGTPAKNDGAKKATAHSTVMAQTGLVTVSSTGVALTCNTPPAMAVVTAAASNAQPVNAMARGAGRSATRPPHQCPAANTD